MKCMAKIWFLSSADDAGKIVSELWVIIFRNHGLKTYYASYEIWFQKYSLIVWLVKILKNNYKYNNYMMYNMREVQASILKAPLHY